MDKKNLTIGILFIMAAFATSIIGAKIQPPPAPIAPAPTLVEGAPGSPAATPGAVASAAPTSALAALAVNRTDAQVNILTNEFVTVRLTDFGGAIQDVAFKKYPAIQGAPEPFVFNARHAAPLLGIGELAGLDQNARFDLVSASATEVVYRAIFEERLEITRRYLLPTG
ncbi:MAG: hypothetical protein EAZ36_04410, partial [Verrucomicrobia bacterium]